MKIVFVVPNFDCGGAERVAVTFAKQLIHAGLDVQFVNVGTAQGNMRQWLEPDIPFVCLNRRRVVTAFFPLIKYLRRTQPTYVYSSWRHVSVVLLLLGYVLPLRIIVREPTMPSNQLVKSDWKQRLLRSCMRHLYKRAYQLIAQTEEMKQEIITRYGVAADKVSVILNPIDEDRIQTQIQGENPFKTDGVNYLAVGNIAYAKAYDVLIQAFSIVLQYQPEAHLYIVGRKESEYATEIMKQATSCSGHIHFEGFQANPYVYMAHCSVFVLSSRMEGCPNVLLEARYLNRRLVATECVPIVNQIVQEGRNGYIVPVNNAERLANAMLQAIQLPVSLLPQTEICLHGNSITDILQ